MIVKRAKFANHMVTGYEEFGQCARYLTMAEEVGLPWIVPRLGVAGAGCGAAQRIVLLPCGPHTMSNGYTIYGYS